MKTQKKHVNDFGNDSVPGLVLRVSVPFMFAQFVNVMYSIVDRIYIGNIPAAGADSLAFPAWVLRRLRGWVSLFLLLR